MPVAKLLVLFDLLMALTAKDDHCLNFSLLSQTQLLSCNLSMETSKEFCYLLQNLHSIIRLNSSPNIIINLIIYPCSLNHQHLNNHLLGLNSLINQSFESFASLR